MREGCCMCKGAVPERGELAKVAKNTYQAREAASVVQGEAENIRRPVPRPRRWGKRGKGLRRKRVPAEDSGGECSGPGAEP